MLPGDCSSERHIVRAVAYGRGVEQALVAIGGAIIVALITAVTTDRRLARQLDAEAKRQERAIEAQEQRQTTELEAADERHRAALGAERDLADLADERALLDEIAVAIYRANDAVGDVALVIRRGWSAVQEGSERAALNERGREIDALTARAGIRFSKDEPLLKSLNFAGAWLAAISAELAWLEDDDRDSWKRKRAAIEEDVERWKSAIETFESDAVGRVGTRPAFGYSLG